jgi:hemoglobin
MMTSLYTHAGGDEGLHRLEEVFYAKVLADPLLKVLFPTAKPHHVQNLTWFTAESFGGPDRFTRNVGFEHIINVHRHLQITHEQRQRFVDLYMEAVDESDMPDDNAFREAIRAHVEFGADVAMQNSRAETDADLNPLRKVPSWSWGGDAQQEPAS